jgi:uncharacterized protein YbaR (Trm112 family)
MWRLKACPKCKGDLFVDRDIDGKFEHCLQCGYVRDIGFVHDLESILAAGKLSAEDEREPVFAGDRRRRKAVSKGGGPSRRGRGSLAVRAR